MSRRKRNPGGGGRTRNPRSLSNLKRGNNDAPVGNTRTLKHGAYARVAAEALDEKATTIFDALSADAPLRDTEGSLPAHDAVVVRLLADCLVRLDRVGGWTVGREATDDGQRALELERKLRDQALDLAESLGMTPRSRSKLGLNIARTAQSFDLARHWQGQGDA
jgi:hypothetical protein